MAGTAGRWDAASASPASAVADECARLLPGAIRGDQRAINQLLAAVYPVIVRYTRARLSREVIPSAEDVAQETCLAVVSSLPRYQDRSASFLSFVYGIAHNKVADALRGHYRDLSTAVEEVPETAAGAATPEERALLDEQCNDVRALLDCLSEKLREIIILRVFVGMSAAETAETIGSTAGAVRVAQHRALAQLRKLVKEGSSANDEQ